MLSGCWFHVGGWQREDLPQKIMGGMRGNALEADPAFHPGEFPFVTPRARGRLWEVPPEVAN